MKKITTRLKRINGQVLGLIKMIESQQDCEKVLTQFQATKAAFESAYAEAIKLNIEFCFSGKVDDKTARLIKLLTKK